MTDSQNNSLKVCVRHGCRKRAKSKFCSDGCRVAHHNAKRAPATKVRIMCLGCKRVFHGRPDQKTCGATCRSRVSALDKDNRQTPTVLPWNGARTRLSRLPSSKNECRHSLWRRGWSTPGSLPHQKKCASAAPRRLPIKCVLTFLRLLR